MWGCSYTMQFNTLSIDIYAQTYSRAGGFCDKGNISMKGQQQYMDTLKSGWAHVASEWAKVGPNIAGPNGYRAAHVHAVRLAHPPLPVFMYLLSCTLLACNGPRVMVWGSLAPIVLWVLNPIIPKRGKVV